MTLTRPHLIGLGLAAVMGWAAPGTAQEQATVLETEFNVHLIDLSGVRTIQSNVVPLAPGEVCFGWRIRLDGEDRLIKAREWEIGWSVAAGFARPAVVDQPAQCRDKALRQPLNCRGVMQRRAIGPCDLELAAADQAVDLQ